jgi:hypothetical protein
MALSETSKVEAEQETEGASSARMVLSLLAEDIVTQLDTPMSVARKLRYYIYVLIDPRTRHPFYVGKGYRRRVLDHFDGQQRSRPQGSEKLAGTPTVAG